MGLQQPPLTPSSPSLLLPCNHYLRLLPHPISDRHRCIHYQLRDHNSVHLLPCRTGVCSDI
uniref:Uncharacterized protein n=1 Tax=Cannabis sativa TaxID=3483 RepID=A0A803R7U7_CANSA